MKQIDIVEKYRGEHFEGKTGIPEDLSEAVQLLGEDEAYRLMLSAYISEQKRALRRKRRKKHLKVPLKDLTDDQLHGLRKLGLL